MTMHLTSPASGHDQNKQDSEDFQRAMLNILDDSYAEKLQLQQSQRAFLNILDDIDLEKTKVTVANRNVESVTAAYRLIEAVKKDLERSNQELDDFSYIASHDLKEPLRGLFNHAQFLMEDYQDKLDAEGVRRLNRLRTLCHRMEQLINDLMYFSRLGRAGLAIQNTDLNGVIADIQQTMDVFIEERHAEIAVPNVLPHVLCDRVRTTEVFRNLITNAIKYNDSTAPRVEIGFKDIAPFDAGLERNVFYVKDNGRGIEPAFHQEIFRIFKRLQPSDAKEAGTGVGLTFVKKIVERQGGRVWLDSDIGKGSTFYFTLESARTDSAKDTHEHAVNPIAVHSAG